MFNKKYKHKKNLLSNKLPNLLIETNKSTNYTNNKILTTKENTLPDIDEKNLKNVKFIIERGINKDVENKSIN